MQFALDQRSAVAVSREPSGAAVSAARAGLAAAVVQSIAEVGRDAWDACFPSELEAYDYLAAIEHARLDGFEFRYASVSEGGRVLACMPAFHTMYSLATTLDPGSVKRAIEGVQKRVPKFMRLKLGCLGSPETECGLVGFHPSVPETRKADLLDALVTAFEADAKASGCYLLAVKDAPASDPLWDGIAARHRYTPMPGMATAHLDIDFKTTDEYLARFSASARKDMRRKLRSLANLRIEHRHSIDDVLEEVYALYLQTMQRADLHLNTLPKAYFTNVLAEMGERALITLYYTRDGAASQPAAVGSVVEPAAGSMNANGERKGGDNNGGGDSNLPGKGPLIAANLHLVDETRLLDKFFVMDGEAGPAHNLYFVSWFVNLQYCLDRGIPHYQSGQACYDVKLRLKSYLKTNRLLFKHVKPGVNRIFRAAAPLFALDDTEKPS
jgi:hypothetical protein